MLITGPFPMKTVLSIPSFLLRQPRLNLSLLCLLQLFQLFLSGIIPRRNLIKRILLTLLKFLPNLLPLLILPQALATPVTLHLLQSPLLECRKRSLESPLRVFINLRRARIVRQAQRIKRIVDTSSIECRCGLR